MNLLELLDPRKLVHSATDFRITARPICTEAGWAAVIESGESVITEADPEGLRIFTNHDPGQGAKLLLSVPGWVEGEPTIEVRALVSWSRPNPIAAFGRRVCGLKFISPGQPDIRPLLHRCRPI